ncbi:MAG: VWA domain-containing protein [Dehalococcoidaceae bacterium]|nr:VWA domain-containing protein [Dehalococcoidaceae bacterium]
MEPKRGIELTTGQKPSQVSITIGSATVNPESHPANTDLRSQKAHVYLVMDTSGSMKGSKLEQVKKGILDFASDAFTKGYSVGLIAFNSTAEHLSLPASSLGGLQKRVSDMNAGGSTNMAEAIKMAHYHLDKTDTTRVMVIATDGKADSKRKTLKEAEKAKADGIDIITIGTDDAEQDFLKKLATREELGCKVKPEVFSRAISDASKLLPPPRAITRL